MENKKILQQVLSVLVIIILAAVGGYYYGARGAKCDLQKAVPAVVAEPLETVLPVEANPYSKVKDVANPFKDSYVNPFAE